MKLVISHQKLGEFTLNMGLIFLEKSNIATTELNPLLANNLQDMGKKKKRLNPEVNTFSHSSFTHSVPTPASDLQVPASL